MFKETNKDDIRTTSVTSFCVFIVNFEHISHLFSFFVDLEKENNFLASA